VQETLEEPRPIGAEAANEAGQAFSEGGAGITRRGLLLATGGLAGASLVAAAAAPVGTLGPDDSGIGDSPWRAGTKLVGFDNEPIYLSQIAVGSFVTAFPEGADPRELGSPVMLVRLAADEVQTRVEWSPQGLVAFSKICTHAGCAVAMLRYGAGDPAAPGPALVCPCHYSTFDPADAGAVLFGPAGRPLPQLPLRLGAGGSVEAAGPMSGPVGPAWWSVRRT
jgi:ubiquinol-cytochrome c reductase iron-sulfur subunit